MMVTAIATKPVRALGAFFGMSLDVLVGMFTQPLAWREYLDQSWFVARVSVLPAVLMMIPYSLINTFIFNILLSEFGAADFSGAGAAFFNVNQIGPLVTVLVTAGASATAMCADLGARTIREELDAQRVMGIDPIQTLIIPRVLAATTVSVALIGLVVLVGMVASFIFCVFSLHVLAGVFVAGMTVVTGPSTRMGAGRLDDLGRRLREVVQALAPPGFTVARPVESTDDLYE
jgi:phospholipid/cholesterol/gamma-HCH transport system permease protein